MPNNRKKITIVVEDITEAYAAELADAMKSRMEVVGHTKYTIKVMRDNKPKPTK